MAYNKNEASKQYLRMKVESASPISLVVLLYDGAVKYLNKAVGEFEHKRMMGFSDNVIKSQNIVRELRDSLDMSVQEVAPQLRALYSYMLRRLIASTVEKDVEPVREVLRMMESLRNTWDKVRAMAESGKIEIPERKKFMIRQEAPKSNFPDSSPSISIRG